MKTILTVSLAAILLAGCASSYDTTNELAPQIKYFLSSNGSITNYLATTDSLNVGLPKLLQSVVPIYPEIARRARVVGSVLIRAWIDSTGIVKKCQVVRTDAEIFNLSAVDAVMQWKFSPYVDNGIILPCWSEILITYNNGIITMSK